MRAGSCVAAIEYGGGSFLRELKRRKVLRACGYYLLVCALTLLLGGVVFPLLGLDPGESSRVLLLVASLGLPIMLVAAWYLQITPRGIVRATSFVERRVLRNIAPINDQRHTDVTSYFRAAPRAEDYPWIIVAETGPLTGLQFGIADSVELGRAVDCDISLVGPHVAPRHARLHVEDGALLVEDLGSDNGTVVNGRRISGRQPLEDGDELRLHDVIFRVHSVGPGDAA